MNTLTSNLQNILDTVKGKKPLKEAFEDMTIDTNTLSVTILTIILFFISGYGAARLSYCYNIHIGNSMGAAYGWSFLAFIFNAFYYPIYGVFLNPICYMGSSAAASSGSVGGRRRS
jgi:hypothetical protein